MTRKLEFNSEPLATAAHITSHIPRRDPAIIILELNPPRRGGTTIICRLSHYSYTLMKRMQNMEKVCLRGGRA